MAELVPRDEFEQRLAEDVGDLMEEEEILAYLLVNKPQLDELVHILRKEERRLSHLSAHEAMLRKQRVSSLVDQAQSVQANYERSIQPDIEEEPNG